MHIAANMMILRNLLIVSALLAASVPARNREVHVTVAVETKAPYGQYLTDDTGRTLYMFTRDTRDIRRSACDLKCAAVWPPFMYEGEFRAGGDAQSRLLGKLTRPDGSTQITYNGWPLYYYKADTKPSQTKGQGATRFGGRWFLVSPKGNKIEM